MSEAWFEDEATFAAAVRDALRDDAPTPVAPGYADLQEIGRGGQGVVYSATHVATRRRVALKVLFDAPGRSRSARRRFERELEIVASLRDPRLVQVYDGGALPDGRPFVVMELVDGAPLDASPAVVAARAGGWARPAADAALALFAETCEAVDHAHRKGVIHRDLKPTNVVVDREGRPRVLDFGLAKTAGLTPGDYVTTAAGRFLGSLPWTSPEQASGREDAVDVRSDVYALGAVLYTLMTGAPPCDADGDLRTALEAIAQRPPEPPSRRVPTADRDAEAIALRALEKDPARRYASAGDLARDVRRLLAGEPLEARRETAWRALVKAARRRRRAAVAAAAATVVLTALLALAVGALEDARASDAAAREALEAARRNETAARDAEELSRRQLAHWLDALSGVDPERDGADARLVDALDRTAARLDESFPDRPAVQLAFRTRLRELYLKLARYDRALEQSDRADALAAQLLAPHDRERLRGALDRARALYGVERYEEARDAWVAASATLASVFGRSDPDRLRAEVGVARAARHFGRAEEAERAAADVVALAKAEPTPERSAIAAAATEILSQLAKERGDATRGLELQQEALGLYVSASGADGTDALKATSDLSVALMVLGRAAEAAELLRPAAPRMTAKLGAEHPLTLSARHNLGVALTRLGEVEEGDRILSDVYELRARRLGADAADTLVTLNEVAGAAARRGEREEAIRLARRLVEGRRRLGANLDLWIAQNNLAGFLRDAGDAAAAEPVYREAVAAADAGLGAAHWIAALFRANLGRCLSDLGRFDESEVLIAEAETRVAEALGADHAH
ncbi:MAG TPA: serine/threonine-protein kinase, partial [Planctomycetota bacterium]|nr:serine/threonine-protein kinase [Planctomycetota bacterium]